MSTPIRIQFSIGSASAPLVKRLVSLIESRGLILEDWEIPAAYRNPNAAPDAEPFRTWEAEYAWGLRDFLKSENADAHNLIRDLIAAEVPFMFAGDADIFQNRSLYAWAPGDPPPTIRDADAADQPMMSTRAFLQLRAETPADDSDALVAAIATYMRPAYNPDTGTVGPA